MRSVPVVSQEPGQPADPPTSSTSPRCSRAYHDTTPDPADPAQRVAFGTSGHRGSAFRGAFNEAHILAITEAICRYRAQRGYAGPLFLGRDTHALSEPATRTALEVLVANGVDVRVDAADGFTPTPALSHAILVANRARTRTSLAGRPRRRDRRHAVAQPARRRRLQVQPAERRPGRHRRHALDPGRGQPASSRRRGATASPASPRVPDVDRARRPRRLRLPRHLRRRPAARRSTWQAIAASGLRDRRRPDGRRLGRLLGRDRRAPRPRPDGRPTTGSTRTFGFMTLDWDGKIRMDPSSPYAMAAAGRAARPVRPRPRQRRRRRPPWRRHPGGRAAEPEPRPVARRSPTCSAAPATWGADVGVGKTLVSSSMIDRVVADLGRRLVEVPVGFKWFVDGLVDGSIGFGGEESAGASFLRRDGTVWTTDKDGIIADLLACELTARTGRDPGVAYAELTERFGAPAYRRIDAPATPDAEGRARAAVAGRRARRRPSPATRSRRSSPGARQRRADRRPQGRDRPAAGSPPGRRARRTSPRSTPRASAARSTSAGSSRRPRRSSRRRPDP